MNGNKANQNKTIRLHGELYKRLLACSKTMGLKPGGMASYILEKESSLIRQQAEQGRAYTLHPLTDVYVPNHNPRPSEEHRVKKIKLTMSPGAFETIWKQAETDLLCMGYEKPEIYTEFCKITKDEQKKLKEYPLCRNFLMAQQKREKEIIVSIFLFYFDKMKYDL